MLPRLVVRGSRQTDRPSRGMRSRGEEEGDDESAGWKIQPSRRTGGEERDRFWGMRIDFDLERGLSLSVFPEQASYRKKVSKCSMIDFEQRKFRKSTRAPIVNRNLILTSIESPNRIHSLFFSNFSPRFGVRVAFEVFHGGATPRKGEEGKRSVPESGGRGKRRREGDEET